MSIANLVGDFESFRLTVKHHEGHTSQLINGLDGQSGSWQTWKRKRRLGSGASGEVWQEVFEDDYGDVHYRAVKICPEAKMREARIDYKRELSALAAFSRSEYAGWFVNLYGWWMDSENICVAMEYLGRGPLSKYITNGLTEVEAKEIIENVLQGLAVMHNSGFTHRDIKPQNILVFQKRPEFRRWWVKIADFGISKQVQDDSESALHSVLGTRPYCAPEILGHLKQYHETSVYTNKVDIWSTGCVLFNLGSHGHMAFSVSDLTRYCDGNIDFNPNELPLHLNNHGINLLKALLQADPKHRPTATEALQYTWFTQSTVTRLDEGTRLQTSPQMRRKINFNSFLDSTISTNASLAPASAGSSEKPLLTMVNSEENDSYLLAGDTSVAAPIQDEAFVVVDEGGDPLLGTTDCVIGTQHLSERLTTAQSTTSINEIDVDYPKRPVSAAAAAAAATVPDIGALNFHSSLGQIGEGAPNASSSLDDWLQENKDLLRAGEVEHDRVALHLAVRQGRLDVVKQLITQGAKIDSRDKLGWTPLHLAARCGHLEVVEWLVKKGTNIHAKDWKGWTPLHVAVRYGQLEEVEWLVKKGADIHEVDNDDRTPLYVAARYGQLEEVKWLVEKGADIHKKNWNGWTPLYVAVRHGQLEEVKWLVEKGANLNKKDNDTSSPLHVAVRHGQLEVVKWLVDKGADINKKDNDGSSPLHVAVSNDKLEMVEWLVMRGVNFRVRNNAGDTPEDVARNWGHLEVAENLRQARLRSASGMK